MKKTIMAMAIATAASGSAVAADLPRGPAPYYPPPASVYNWTGPYAGLNLGYEWGKVTNNVTEPSGIAGGRKERTHGWPGTVLSLSCRNASRSRWTFGPAACHGAFPLGQPPSGGS